MQLKEAPKFLTTARNIGFIRSEILKNMSRGEFSKSGQASFAQATVASSKVSHASPIDNKLKAILPLAIR